MISAGSVAEKAIGQRDVIRPVGGIALGCEQVRQLPTGLLAQSDEVDGLAPCCAFFGIPSRRHLTNHARQDIVRTLPADDIKTFERLVDEIERVSAMTVAMIRPVAITPGAVQLAVIQMARDPAPDTACNGR
jgi:hypothetical protein